jgi:cation diffusion facilitator family transporter
MASPELTGLPATRTSPFFGRTRGERRASGANSPPGRSLFPASHPYEYGDGTDGYTIRFPARTNSPDGEGGVATNPESHLSSVSRALWWSLGVNILLFGTKTYSAAISGSLSVAASAVDSALDLLAQGIAMLAERGSKQHDRTLYPAGRSRLEPVGIILCAALMGMAALQLILESGGQLMQGFGKGGAPPTVSFDVFTLAMLGATIGVKAVLWFYCSLYSKYSPTLYALAVDHRNDVLSNLVALLAALLAWWLPSVWSADPIGAILMSVWICWAWIAIGSEQIDLIVGKAADPEFIEELQQLSSNFHPSLVPDIIRA